MTTPEAVAGADLGGYSGATGGDRAPAVPGSNNLSDGTSRATLGLRSTDMRNSARESAFPAPDKEVVVSGGGNKEATPRSPSSIAFPTRRPRRRSPRGATCP